MELDTCRPMMPGCLERGDRHDRQPLLRKSFQENLPKVGEHVDLTRSCKPAVRTSVDMPVNFKFPGAWSCVGCSGGWRRLHGSFLGGAPFLFNPGHQGPAEWKGRGGKAFRPCRA
jgi:hypothetical protein